ncbi:MAG TPA: hypothetical protein VIV06_08525, partial [Candidatus Limnocylindrales bacterium]
PDTDPGLPLEERSPFASADERGADVRAEGADGPGPGAMTDDGSLGQAVPVRDEPSAIAAADETCADERKASEERCAAADRLLEQAEAAQARLREAQRTADGHQARATEAGLLADPRAIRSSKEAAQLAFRNARAVARSADAVEAAARTWLQEINRVNHAAREASVVLRHEQEAANALAPVVERLSLEADAARITAEAARESCIAAREALAGCEEAAAAANRAPRARPGVHEPASPEPTAGEAASPGPAARETAAAVRGAGGGEAASAVAGEAGDGGTGEVLEPGLVAPADRDGLPALFRLLHGERQAMTRIVDQLSGNDPADRRRWQLQLSDLVDALLARAIESAVLDFPAGHSFWGLFSRDESRDIAGALASLGYRFDGLGGFVDGRVPSQRDLSLALGFAGLDPMRIRRWPSETEMAGLYREVTVAADEYVAGAAGSLSLGELVTVLGRRADGLTDLWNNWGRVRPLLVASD